MKVHRFGWNIFYQLRLRSLRITSVLIFALIIGQASITYAVDPAPGAACAVNNARTFSGGVELGGIGHWLVCVAGTWQASYTSTAAGLMAVGTTGVDAGVRMEVGGGLRLSPGASGAAGFLQFTELMSNGTNSVSLRAPDNLASNFSITLPTTSGSAGWSLVNVGNGTLGWTTGGAPSFPLLANPQGTAGAPAYSFSTTTNTGMYSTGVGTLAFSTAGTNAVTITNLGRVGIGTTNPSERLSVHGGSIYVHHGPGEGLVLSSEGMSQSSNTEMAVMNESWNDLVFGTWGVERMRITHGSVGIGTASPTAKLQVQGDIKWAGAGSVGIYAPTAGNYSLRWPNHAGALGQALITSGTGGILSWGTPVATPSFPLLSTTRGSAATPAYSFSDDSDTGIFSPSANSLALTTFGTNRIHITNDGRVGIGTTAPGPKLHLVDSFSSAVGVTAGAIDAYLSADTSVGGAVLGVESNHDLRIFTNDTERMIVLGSGNIGIGTSEPEEALEVVGDIKSNGLGIEHATTPRLSLFRSDSTVTSGELLGRIVIGNDDSLFVNPAVSFVASETHSGTAAGSYTTFSTVPNSGTLAVERLRIDQTGFVGIGTTAPTARLEVLGDVKWAGAGSVGIYPPTAGNYTLTWPAHAGALGQALLTSGTGGILSWGTPVAMPSFPILANPQGTAGAPAYSFSNTTNTGMYSTGVGTLAFATAGTGAVTINNLGHVGIGNTNPTVALQIGTALNSASPKVLMIGDTTQNTAVALGEDSDNYSAMTWNAADNTLRFGTRSAATGYWSTMNLNNGRVGIGITNPSVKLHTYEASAANVAFVQSGGTISQLGAADGILGNVGTYSNHPFGIITNNVERMTFNTGGSVGVGTSAPGDRFHVAVTDESAGIMIENTSSTAPRFPWLTIKNQGGSTPGNPTINMQSLRTSGILADDVLGTIVFQGNGPTVWPEGARIRVNAEGNFSDTAGPSNMAFHTASTGAPVERMRISSAGSVGIGTTAPTAKLQVQGDIKWSGAGSVGIYAPTAGNYTLRWPNHAGAAGQALLTSGTGGILSWGAPVAATSFPLLANPQGTAGAPAYSFSTTTNTGMYSTGVGTLAFSTAGTNAVTINNLGNVGIGNSATTSRLTVNQDGNGPTYPLRVTNNTANNWGVGPNIRFEGIGGLEMASMGTWWTSGSDTNHAMFNMYSRKNGAMVHGMGFNEQGPFDHPGVTFGGYPVGSMDWGRVLVTTQSSTGNSVVDSLSMLHHDSDGGASNGIGNRLKFITETSTNNTMATSAAIVSVMDTVADTARNGSLRFETMGPNVGTGVTTATEKMRITGGGSVGIGTTNPLHALDVAPPGNAVGALGLRSTGGAGARIYFGTNGQYDGSGSNHAGVLTFGQQIAGGFEFRTNNGSGNPDNSSQTKMSIAANGNVGIGTTAPTARLQVQGDIKWGGAGSVGIYAPTAGNYSLRWPNHAGAAGQALLTSGTGGILSWGSPVASTSFPLLANPQGTAGAPAYSFSTTTNTGMYSTGVGTLAFSTGGTERMRITAAGSVGIGTTNPTGKLHVDGNLIVTNGDVDSGGTFFSSNARSFEAAAGSAAWPSYSFSGSEATGIYRPASQTLGFSTNGVERLRITSGGSVGIGTTAPAESA